MGEGVPSGLDGLPGDRQHSVRRESLNVQPDLNLTEFSTNVPSEVPILSLSQVNFNENQTSDENPEPTSHYYELDEDGSIPVISKSGFRICHLNVNSIPNKIDEIKYMLKNSPFDIVAFTETHCDDSVSDRELQLDDFDFVRKDRTRHGGGVLLYIKKKLGFLHLLEIECELEALWISVKLRDLKSFYICVIYRPPNSTDQFFDTLSTMLNKELDMDGEVVVVGDFNCDLSSNNLDSKTQMLISTMEGSLLTQLIDSPTRVTMNSRTLIDHIYNTCGDNHVLSGVVKTHVSDHFLTFTIINCKGDYQSPNTVRYRSFKNFKEDAFVNDLIKLPFIDIKKENDVDEAWGKWYDLLMGVVDKHAPYKIKKVRKKHCPWITKDIITLMHTRDYFHRKAMKYNLSKYWEEYRKKRNEVTSRIRLSKQEYVQGLLKENAGNTNALWSTIKHLSGNGNDSSIKLNVDGENVVAPERVAENLNNYFIDSVSELLYRETNGHVNNAEVLDNIDCIFRGATGDNSNTMENEEYDLPEMTIEYLVKEIDILSTSKSTGSDDISVKILKALKGASNALESLVYISNLSFSSGTYPMAWGLAKIRPIFKAGDRLSVENYRPISLLSIVSKIVEKCVQKSYYSFLLQTNYFCNNQFGFRPGHSCEIALLCMTDDWAAQVDKGNLCGLGFVDMRKAFDSVNHNVLLKKLKISGCSDKAVKWFRSYLCYREQYTVIDGKSSSRRSVSSGVPQGSVLGPLLFTIYVNDIPSRVKTGKMFMFADDATVFVSGPSVESIQNQLTQAMQEVQEWTVDNKLILNTKKTKVMLMGSRQKLQRLENRELHIVINNHELECVAQTKCLGVVIDNTLSFKFHVDAVVKSMKQKIGMIRRIKHLFTADQLSTLYWGFVMPHAMYCSTVWSSKSEGNYNTINKLHKRAAYIVSGSTWQTPSEQVMRDLGWKTLKEIFHKSIACMVYKCVNGIAPQILSDRFCRNDDVSLRHTRSTDRLLLRPPLCRTQFYQNSFIYAGSITWNSLPDDYRNSDSLAIFKMYLKRNTTN